MSSNQLKLPKWSNELKLAGMDHLWCKKDNEAVMRTFFEHFTMFLRKRLSARTQNIKLILKPKAIELIDQDASNDAKYLRIVKLNLFEPKIAKPIDVACQCCGVIVKYGFILNQLEVCDACVSFIFGQSNIPLLQRLHIALKFNKMWESDQSQACQFLSTIYDLWSNYRHQSRRNKNCWQDGK